MTRHCPICGVNILRFCLITIVGFIFVFGYDFVFHAILLDGLYQSTAQLWRGKEEIQAFMPLAMASQYAYVFALAFVFTRNYEEKGMIEGMRFGFYLGAVLGIAQFGIYPYMPIPLSLALSWFGGTLLQITILGVIFSLLYKK